MDLQSTTKSSNSRKHQIRLQEDMDLAVGPCNCVRGHGAFGGFHRGEEWKRGGSREPSLQAPWHPIGGACEAQQGATTPRRGTSCEGALPDNVVRRHRAATLLRLRCQGGGPPSSSDGGPASSAEGGASSSI